MRGGFGGSVKLTGATEYKKSLQQISQELKSVSAEMKATSTAFDIGDKSQKEVEKSAKEMLFPRSSAYCWSFREKWKQI